MGIFESIERTFVTVGTVAAVVVVINFIIPSLVCSAVNNRNSSVMLREKKVGESENAIYTYYK